MNNNEKKIEIITSEGRFITFIEGNLKDIIKKLLYTDTTHTLIGDVIIKKEVVSVIRYIL